MPRHVRARHPARTETATFTPLIVRSPDGPSPTGVRSGPTRLRRNAVTTSLTTLHVDVACGAGGVHPSVSAVRSDFASDAGAADLAITAPMPPAPEATTHRSSNALWPAP